MIKDSHIMVGKICDLTKKLILHYALAESLDELLVIAQPIHIIHQ